MRRRFFQFTIRSLVIVTAIVACLLGWLRSRREEWRRETANLECSWEFVTTNSAAQHTVTFADGTYVCRYPSDGSGRSGSYAINPLTRPRQIDVVTSAGTVLRGIYQINSEQLLIVRQTNDTYRPTSVDDSRESYILEYRRVRLAGR
jgi:uncharacterized protein (TIGR03067 family)